MGTDIHLYIERRTATGWQRVRPTAYTCSWCQGGGKKSDKSGDDCYWCDGKGTTTEEYGDRNYNLFAMLAGVRNGRGFAGVDTGDGFEPLSEPRGLPDDTSLKNTDDDDYDSPGHIWLGYHSFSHCTLAEVLAYDYSRTTKHRGIVDSAEYAKWVEFGRKGPPDNWCGGISGGGVKIVSNTELDELIANGTAPTSGSGGPFDHPKSANGLSYFTRIEWEETYRQSAGAAWFEFLEACRPLGKPEDVRFVFGFDS
jgi:hypothetical protein